MKLLLDAFCCAGGAGMGYTRAGFEVVGVDINLQKNYPFEFHRGDAIEFIRKYGKDFDAIHASPPCQAYAGVTAWRGDRSSHADLVAPTRDVLESVGRTWVIENVPEAPVRRDLTLCGSHFGLRVKRHRVFESSTPLKAPDEVCSHHGLLPFMHKQERTYANAMGCDWMTTREGRQAIPPAYTEFIGRQLMQSLV